MLARTSGLYRPTFPVSLKNVERLVLLYGFVLVDSFLFPVFSQCLPYPLPFLYRLLGFYGIFKFPSGFVLRM